MSETIETTVDGETVEQAVETERRLTEEKDNTVGKYDVRRKHGFYPCEVTEFRTISSGEFNELNHSDFDEDRICFRRGFGFMSDKTATDLRRYSLPFPETNSEDVITVKYELVGADEDWEIREFWEFSEFPENSFLRTIPASRIGNIVGKKVPIVKQYTHKNGVNREYVIASLATESTNDNDKQYSVPHMTINSGLSSIPLKAVVSFASTISVLGVLMLTFGGTPDSFLALCLMISLTLFAEWLTFSRSDWFYKRVKNRIHDSELPSNPYHNQFDSIPQFAEETSR